MNFESSHFGGGRGFVRVFLIEHQRLVAEALRQIFARDSTIEIVGESPQVDVDALTLLKPGVIVLDIDNANVQIESAIVACERASPQSRVCVLSAQSRPRTMQRVLAANASAYIVKDTQPPVLIEIIHSVSRGEFYADPRVAGSLLRRRTSRATEGKLLTAREYEIIRLIAEGLSNRQIGARLSLSEKTVKNHVSHVLAKLQVSARSGIAVYAVRNGIIH